MSVSASERTGGVYAFSNCPVICQKYVNHSCYKVQQDFQLVHKWIKKKSLGFIGNTVDIKVNSMSISILFILKC